MDTQPTSTAPPRGDDPYARQPWLASYPAGVGRGLDVPAVPLPRLLDDAADRHGDRVALAFLGARTTYADLRGQVDRCAAALAGLGTGRGDRVALVLPNCPQAVVTWLAALRLGAVVVPLDPLGGAVELGRRLADSGATVAVCHDRAYAALASARGRTALRHVVVTALADALPRRTRLSLRLPIARARQARAELPARVAEGDRVRRYADLVRQRAAPPQVGLDAEREIAVLLYTAGTTGPARGAMLTHHALVAGAHQARAWLVPAPAGREVVLAGLPLWHPSGPTLCLATSLLLGATLVLVPRLDREELRRAVGENRPTLVLGMPDLLADLVAAGDDLTSVRVAVSAGAGLVAGLPERFATRSGRRFVSVYGAAEAPLTHAQDGSGPWQPGTIGLPLPGTRAQVVDPADPTRVQPAGAPGELAVTGPQVAVGYWRHPRDTRGTVTPDGHHLTGDLAVMDEAGVFTLLGRRGGGSPSVSAGAGSAAPAAAAVVTRAGAGPEAPGAATAPTRRPRPRAAGPDAGPARTTRPAAPAGAGGAGGPAAPRAAPARRPTASPAARPQTGGAPAPVPRPSPRGRAREPVAPPPPGAVHSGREPGSAGLPSPAVPPPAAPRTGARRTSTRTRREPAGPPSATPPAPGARPQDPAPPASAAGSRPRTRRASTPR